MRGMLICDESELMVVIKGTYLMLHALMKTLTREGFALQICWRVEYESISLDRIPFNL